MFQSKNLQYLTVHLLYKMPQQQMSDTYYIHTTLFNRNQQTSTKKTIKQSEFALCQLTGIVKFQLQLVSSRHLSDIGRRTPALTVNAGSSSVSGWSATRQRSSSSSCRSAAASMAFGFVAMMSTGGGGTVGNDQTNRAPSDEQLTMDF